MKVRRELLLVAVASGLSVNLHHVDEVIFSMVGGKIFPFIDRRKKRNPVWHGFAAQFGILPATVCMPIEYRIIFAAMGIIESPGIFEGMDIQPKAKK